jgi:hypothetical protein
MKESDNPYSVERQQKFRFIPVKSGGEQSKWALDEG